MSNQQPVEETFISHLVELRNRLVKAALGVVLMTGALLIWPGPSHIYDIIAQPMVNALPAGSKMIATGVIAPFLVPLKIALLSGLILSLPWVLYQVWAFVAPGLYAHEKRLIAPLVVSSSLLFVIGVAFCYFLVFKRAFAFISAFSPSSISVMPDIENYLDFVMSMCLAFGCAFEVPIVVVVLVRMGLVSVAKLKEWRGYVIVAAFVIAAIVTPPDAVSQFALAIPMWLLFELGVLLSPLFVKMTQAPSEQQE